MTIIDSHAFTDVVRSKLKLRLSCFFLFLGLDVSSDDVFIDSNRRDKISFSPNTLFVPIDFFQERKLFTQCSAAVLFDGFNNHAYRIFWGYHHIQMDMILFYPHLNVDPVRINFPDFLQFYFQITFDSGYDDFPAIAGNPNYMVLGFVYGMSCFE